MFLSENASTITEKGKKEWSWEEEAGVLAGTQKRQTARGNTQKLHLPEKRTQRVFSVWL